MQFGSKLQCIQDMGIGVIAMSFLNVLGKIINIQYFGSAWVIVDPQNIPPPKWRLNVTVFRKIHVHVPYKLNPCVKADVLGRTLLGHKPEYC
jgi:hypothetical protein